MTKKNIKSFFSLIGLGILLLGIIFVSEKMLNTGSKNQIKNSGQNQEQDLANQKQVASQEELEQIIPFDFSAPKNSQDKELTALDFGSKIPQASQKTSMSDAFLKMKNTQPTLSQNPSYYRSGSAYDNSDLRLRISDQTNSFNSGLIAPICPTCGSGSGSNSSPNNSSSSGSSAAIGDIGIKNTLLQDCLTQNNLLGFTIAQGVSSEILGLNPCSCSTLGCNSPPAYCGNNPCCCVCCKTCCAGL